ncbi:MAG: sugar ABC transporter permease [Anaerolineae bacterium]|nr:sugar ABC transporter permease [Anaerolineae bacterium]
MTTTNTTIRSQSAAIPQVRLSERVWRRALPYLLVFPTFLFVVMFTLWPTVSAVINSTIKPPPTVKQQAKFVGLQNYIDLFDPDTPIGDDFPRVFTNTLIFVGLTVPICMALAFALAMLLNRKIRALGLYRFAFFYPVLMPLIGAGSIFAFIFADTIGLANTVLRSFGLAGIKWVGDANWTFISIMLVTIWKQTGFFMIMYLAGLQNLPQDVYEAADLDGATIWQKIRYLTFPLLRGTTLFILTTGAAGAFQQVDQLYALGEGAPNQRSNLILYFLFQKYNEPRNLGYVNAITVILLILLLSFTVINFVLWERQTYYEN